MQTKKSDYISEIFSTKESIKNFLDTSCESIIFINSNGTILHANKCVEKTLAIPVSKLLNRNIKSLFAKNGSSENISEFKKIIKNTESSSNELLLHFKRKGSDSFPAIVTINSLNNNNGKIICCLLKELSDKELEIEKLKREKESAEQLAQLKTDYLAQLSHEIRTPLNLMINFTSLIREVLDTETRKSLKEEFAIISNAGKRIIRTADLVLNMSSIQSGTFEIHKTKFDLYKEIVNRIEQDFMFHAKERKLKFTVKNSLTNATITADEYTVYQSVMNIVDNAFKYTEKGEIEIKLSRNRKGQIYLLVSDTGIGMSEEYQKDLFKPFHQEDNGFAAKIKGNGLGLSLVKKYCEMNDIVIEVNSKKDIGTKIKLTFPK